MWKKDIEIIIIYSRYSFILRFISRCGRFFLNLFTYGSFQFLIILCFATFKNKIRIYKILLLFLGRFLLFFIYLDLDFFSVIYWNLFFLEDSLLISDFSERYLPLLILSSPAFLLSWIFSLGFLIYFDNFLRLNACLNIYIDVSKDINSETRLKIIFKTLSSNLKIGLIWS